MRHPQRRTHRPQPRRHPLGQRSHPRPRQRPQAALCSARRRRRRGHPQLPPAARSKTSSGKEIHPQRSCSTQRFAGDAPPHYSQRRPHRQTLALATDFRGHPSPHPAPRLRNSHAGGRRRPPRHSRVARPRTPLHHPALHPAHRRADHRRSTTAPILGPGENGSQLSNLKKKL